MKNNNIINLINSINDIKVKVVEAYKNMENAEDMDISSLYYNLCENMMDICREKLEELYNIVENELNENFLDVEEYLLCNYDFEYFDASIIFDYLG